MFPSSEQVPCAASSTCGRLQAGLTVAEWCRYAEMDPVAKNEISHRYKALDLLRKYLLEEAAKTA